MPLVAFNVNLGTSNLEIANKIAKIVRGSSGGFKYCKAIGVMLEDRNLAQVSMNMVNYEGTPLYRVFELIRIEAERYGSADHRHRGCRPHPGQGAGGLRRILPQGRKLRLSQAGA